MRNGITRKVSEPLFIQGLEQAGRASVPSGLLWEHDGSSPRLFVPADVSGQAGVGATAVGAMIDFSGVSGAEDVAGGAACGVGDGTDDVGSDEEGSKGGTQDGGDAEDEEDDDEEDDDEEDDNEEGTAEKWEDVDELAGTEAGPLVDQIRHIFVYGSLRPDDDSGQAWTAEYVDGFDVVARAVLPEALLWKDTYACVSLDGTSDDVVNGYLLGIPDPSKRLAWEAKLAQADQIEGFDPEDPVGGSLYQRAIVRAAVVNTDMVGYDGYDAVWAYVQTEHLYNIQGSEIFTLRNEKFHTEI